MRYYDIQLGKLDRTARISIKLVDGAFNETNWLDLNKDCKQALLTFLGVRDATYTKGPGSEPVCICERVRKNKLTERYDETT